MPELDFRRGAVGVDVDRERRLEDLLDLMPVDLGLDVHAPAAGAEPDCLRDAGRAERALDPDSTDERPAVYHRDRVDRGEVAVLMPVVPVDGPGVPLVGQVGVELEEVAARARREHLTAGGQVAYRREKAVVVQLYPQETVVQQAIGDGDRRRRRGLDERS